MPRRQCLLERRGVQQLGASSNSAEHAAPLEHVKITAHCLGGDSQLLTDLQHTGPPAIVLDQQIGDRPLSLGRIHRHSCLPGHHFHTDDRIVALAQPIDRANGQANRSASTRTLDLLSWLR